LELGGVGGGAGGASVGPGSLGGDAALNYETHKFARDLEFSGDVPVAPGLG